MALIEFQNNTAPYLNADNLNNNFNYLDEKNDYSLQEKIIGKWINGKPIYRKAFVGTTNLSGNETTMNISNLDNLIKVDGVIKTLGYINPIGIYTGTDNFISSYFNTTSNNLTLNYTDNYRNKDYYTIVEYTKTTDEGDE